MNKGETNILEIIILNLILLIKILTSGLPNDFHSEKLLLGHLPIMEQVQINSQFTFKKGIIPVFHIMPVFDIDKT